MFTIGIPIFMIMFVVAITQPDDTPQETSCEYDIGSKQHKMGLSQNELMQYIPWFPMAIE